MEDKLDLIRELSSVIGEYLSIRRDNFKKMSLPGCLQDSAD